MSTGIVWFRNELRLTDNRALAAACRAHDAVVCVHIAEEPRALGHARQLWLHRSLAALDESLRERGSWLVVRGGAAEDALATLSAECGASAVYAPRDWGPAGLRSERVCDRVLRERGVALHLSPANLLVEPGAIVTGSGSGYRVFSAYYRAWRRSADLSPKLVPAPKSIPRPALMPSSAGPLTPDPGGPDVSGWWTPGELGAKVRLARFVTEALPSYDEQRDRPDLRSTSELSPHLAAGEISIREVVRACVSTGEAAEGFIRQLAWREFAADVLYRAPQVGTEPLRPEFSRMPWAEDPGGFEAWKAGSTGYPLVDAGMRQLAATGWMHNRVRLVAASLLCKHLLLPWQIGEAYFRERLVDHDEASNAFNWQWVAGSGYDAAPYFRIFNPALQGERFDPGGDYVRRWIPELAGVKGRAIHRPWASPDSSARAEAGGYPAPIVDHALARRRALDAFSSVVSPSGG